MQNTKPCATEIESKGTAVTIPDDIVNRDLFEVARQLGQAEYVLQSAGFRRCDIPACNCGSWHQVGGYKARFDEIKEVVEYAGYSTNGRTLLDAVKHMASDASSITRVND